MSELLDRIANDLTLPKGLIERALADAHYRYKRIHIAKKSGGVRVMLQPAARLKPLLIWIDRLILSKLPVSDIATAFSSGTSILKNAYAHRDSLFSVRVDISNFFPSIRSHDLEKTIENSIGRLPQWAANADTKELLAKACFDKTNRLPIGYPTSPQIANAVMFEIDAMLVKNITEKTRFGEAVLTRYADDFLFSTNKRGACSEFVKEIQHILSKSPKPKLQLNHSKTRFMSRRGGSTLITGLRVKQNSDVSVHPNYRDHVRLLLKLYAQARLKPEDKPRLLGHLSYIQHVDPALFTRLSYKYVNEIAVLRNT